MATNTVASLEAAEAPAINETVVFVNISEHGARLITRRSWPVGKRVIVSDSLLNYRATGEVVYCAPHSSRRFAIGVKFS
jgi:archaeosine-15-forming tRNA-guanine transglycosylase